MKTSGRNYLLGSLSFGPGSSGLSGLSGFSGTFPLAGFTFIPGASIFGGLAGVALPGVSTFAPLSITMLKCAWPLITKSVGMIFALELTNVVVFDNPAPISTRL